MSKASDFNPAAIEVISITEKRPATATDPGWYQAKVRGVFTLELNVRDGKIQAPFSGKYPLIEEWVAVSQIPARVGRFAIPEAPEPQEI